MRLALLSILLFSCTTSRVSTQKEVTLDASQSRVIGGDGTGRIVVWEWKDLGNNRVVGITPITTVIVGSGDYVWQLKAIDNLGNKDSLIIKTN
jgi:hypothetical protein